MEIMSRSKCELRGKRREAPWTDAARVSTAEQAITEYVQNPRLPETSNNPVLPAQPKHCQARETV